MTSYARGANAERELISFLWDRGFAATRTAGSGASILPAPDLVALSKDFKFAFECKFWRANYLHISRKNFTDQLEWCSRADAFFVVAWKIPRKGWFFLPEHLFNSNEKFFTISLSKAYSDGLSFDELLVFASSSK